MVDRRSIGVGVGIGVGAVAVALFIASAAAPASAGSSPARGVVGSTCDGSRVAAERAAGITSAVFNASWERLIPARGVVDRGYVATMTAAMRTCSAAGISVVLDAGLPYVPSWVRQLPGATLLDQYGDVPVNHQLDLVYNEAVRSAAGDYLRQLVSVLPTDTVSAIRVGTTTSGELGLPGGGDGGHGHTDSWWAFGTAPQTGRGLATGQSFSPLPGWIPGQATWNGRDVTPADALSWWHWYERSVLQAEWFLARSVQLAGFTGAIHLPVAGRGVLPADLTAATTSLLAGASRHDDAFARGLDYVDQMPLLGTALPGVVIDLTSVDDASAVAARTFWSPQDSCATGDAEASVAPSTPVERWSNLRFARAQVSRAGLLAVGENPGPPGPLTGGVSTSDSETEQLRRSPDYARACGLAVLQFAFEEDLFTGQSGVTLSGFTSSW